MLSRQQMEEAIIQKGSVLYRGQVIHRIQDLPSEAELAAGDPEKEAAAAAVLDAQIAALQAQRDRLALARQSPMISPVAGAKQEPSPSETADEGQEPPRGRKKG